MTSRMMKPRSLLSSSSPFQSLRLGTRIHRTNSTHHRHFIKLGNNSQTMGITNRCFGNGNGSTIGISNGSGIGIAERAARNTLTVVQQSQRAQLNKTKSNLLSSVASGSANVYGNGSNNDRNTTDKSGTTGTRKQFNKDGKEGGESQVFAPMNGKAKAKGKAAEKMKSSVGQSSLSSSSSAPAVGGAASTSPSSTTVEKLLFANGKSMPIDMREKLSISNLQERWIVDDEDDARRVLGVLHGLSVKTFQSLYNWAKSETKETIAEKKGEGEYAGEKIGEAPAANIKTFVEAYNRGQGIMSPQTHGGPGPSREWLRISLPDGTQVEDMHPWAKKPKAADLANELVETQDEFVQLHGSVLSRRYEKANASGARANGNSEVANVPSSSSRSSNSSALSSSSSSEEHNEGENGEDPQPWSSQMMNSPECIKKDAIAKAMIKERNLPDLDDDEITKVNEEHRSNFGTPKVEYLGNDVFKTSVEEIGAVGGLTTDKPFLFTRFDSLCIVEHILHIMHVYAEKKRNRGTQSHKEHGAILGPPGISKSFTLLQALRRLVALGKTVVWADRKRDQLNLFVRDTSTGKYHAWARPGTMVSLPESIGGNSEVCILFDPKEDGEGGSLGLWNAFTIMATSANIKHYYNEYKNGLRFYYFTVWDLQELRRIEPFLDDGSQTFEEDLESRYLKVGGAPRYLFSVEDYNGRLALLNGPKDEFPQTSVQQYLEGSVVGFTQAKGEKNISGLFFQADGIAPTYKEATLAFNSPYAAATFANIYRSKIMAGINLRIHDDSTLQGHIFERIARKDLVEGGDFSVYDGQANSKFGEKSNNLHLSAASIRETRNAEATRGWLQETRNPNSRRELLYPPKNQACFDFADGPRRWYQITVNPKHTINFPKFLEFAKVVGVLEEDPQSPGKYRRVGEEVIDLYLCVPEREVRAFKSVQSFEQVGKDRVAKHNHVVAQSVVQQHLLIIPTNDPRDKEGAG